MMENLEMFHVRQDVCRKRIVSIEKVLLKELKDKNAEKMVRPGYRVALAVGSRGIAALPEIVNCLTKWLQSHGALPFIVPAMGSHGGATAQGQLRVLDSLGISEQKLGIPVLSSMEVVKIGYTRQGAPVYVDSLAYNADALVVINRIKPHTAMRGAIQSGLLKMLAVGLGKQKGAQSMHQYGLEENIPEAARMVIEKAPVIFGVAIVENADGEPYNISVVPATVMLEKEQALLKESFSLLPVIPFEPIDVLLVRWMGKNISGSGMDTNVLGRWRRVGGSIDKVIRRIGVFGLTAESKGNAYGVGMADFITRALYEKIDLESTYANALASGWFNGVKIPMILKDEKTLFEYATFGFKKDTIRLVLIENTLNLQEMWVSKVLMEEACNLPFLKVLSGPLFVDFDAGKLVLVRK